jgi:hypothetical protein
MWLVAKSSGADQFQTAAIAGDAKAALIAWYSGIGSDADETVAVRLAQKAHSQGLWLACDCLRASVPRPLMSVAFLTHAETYYLRRLTGNQRSVHDANCPFFREQLSHNSEAMVRETGLVAPPDGYFSVLTPEPVKLAQFPLGVPADDRQDRVTTPRLARLLWHLIDRARLNRLPPLGLRQEDETRSIASEFAALKQATRGLHIAPGIELIRAYHDYAPSYKSTQIFARLRALARIWPDDHAPQAFLLLYANEVHGNEIYGAMPDPILVASRVQRAPVDHGTVSGPFLCLVVIGDHPEAHGYTAVRAYAQPIVNGHHFIPVGSDIERHMFMRLIGLQKQLKREGIALELTKPLFDDLTRPGLIRADALVQASNRQGIITRIRLVIGSDEGLDLTPSSEQAPPDSAFDRSDIFVTPQDLASGAFEQVLLAYIYSD